MKICKVEGCENKYSAKGYCVRHYVQFKKYGKIPDRTKNDPNEIIDCGDYYEICLYDRKCKEIARTKIDKNNLAEVDGFKWSLDSCGYSKNGKNKIFLHQLILGKKEGYDIDHINHDTLDNRKQNLRFATRSQNTMNKKSKGYSIDKRVNKFEVRIGVNSKRIHLGMFINEQDAINARKEAEKKYFGEFAFNC